MRNLTYDDFDVGDCIGSGTVATVYRVTEKRSGEDRALKLLSPALSTDPLIISRFEREILILSKLDHPNIVGYHGHGEHDGQLFYVMEFVQGMTLKQLLSDNVSLTWREAAECGRQLAAALQHAHNHGIIHRDLKPGNVYLTRDGYSKLGDFGIARDIRSLELTDAGLTVGTYWYMSPELVRGQRYITGKVDLYALGCLLFEMLTGHPPFLGDNFAQIFEQHLHTPPPHPRDSAFECPSQLDDLVIALLSKDPEQRPFNARAVQGELGELLAEQPIADPDRPGDAADRGAASVTGARATLAQRIQVASPRKEASWTAILMLAGAIVVIIAIASVLTR